MNGYTMMADSYRLLMEQGKIDKQLAEKEIRVFEFLATCNLDDLFMMVDSTAFNDIITAFLRLAVNNAGIDESSKEKVVNQLYRLFDEKTAKEVCEDETEKGGEFV